MRRLSPHCTPLLLRTSFTPNGVTWLMTACGLLAALVLTLPGLAARLAAVVLIQLQLLFDCSDGEMARWLRQALARGRLPRPHRALRHGGGAAGRARIRADGGWDEIGGWTTLALAAAVLSSARQAESALVAVVGRRRASAARDAAGWPPRAPPPCARCAARSASHPSFRALRRGGGEPARPRRRGDRLPSPATLAGTRWLVTALVPHRRGHGGRPPRRPSSPPTASLTASMRNRAERATDGAPVARRDACQLPAIVHHTPSFGRSRPAHQRTTVSMRNRARFGRMPGGRPPGHAAPCPATAASCTSSSSRAALVPPATR